MNNIPFLRIFIALVCLFAARTVAALDVSHYAEESVLASGSWVKISVDETGLYRIPAATLRQWGFTDASKVRIHGYGGRRIADALNAANYIDDLPAVQSQSCADGSIVFYAVGPDQWEGGAQEVKVRRSSPYTTAGYYFVTSSDTEARTFATTATPGATNPATTFIERLHHEQDLVSPGECGVMLVGEDFRYTPTRKFTFNMPDRCDSVMFKTSFVAKTYNTSSRLEFTANGRTVPQSSTDYVGQSGSGEVHGVEGRTSHVLHADTFNLGEKLELTISHKSSSVVYNAWLNYISVNYVRRLSLPAEGWLDFSVTTPALSLAGAAEATHIWDVTDPADIRSVDFSVASRAAQWTARQSGARDYVAWNDNARLPSPVTVGFVTNQNLHADRDIDMVIFTHPAWLAQAERIAELHRGEPDNMTVKVVEVDEVYNEFSSGAADVSGLRKYLKMLYDRGNEGERPLRFALLMGRMTYDERHLTAGVKALGCPTIPAWQLRDERNSLDSELGFVTDDFLAMLEDGSGSRLGSDKLSVAVGRLPVTSASSAKLVTDKIVNYSRRPPRGAWKNKVLGLADDLDYGVHPKQTEWFMRGFEQNENNPYILEKIYLPAYELSGGVFPAAREQMFRQLNDGVAWWTFVGHATNHSWTGNGMLTYSDINSFYLRRLPFVYAATCNFLRWDSNNLSGGEILMFEQNGGVIGMISATRPVYITYNGYFTNAIGKEVARRENGRLPATGEIYRRAKNNIRSVDERTGREGEIVNNDNRLRYVFMGDPALRLATPDNLVAIESIGGVSLDTDEQIVLPARGTPVIKGAVTSSDGTVLSDFNGTLLLDLYDADRSVDYVPNLDHYDACEPFDIHGDLLYSGSCRVTDGRFELSVAMPLQISDNFREATISMVAYSDDGETEASGLNHDCYVYGFDELAADDNEAPVIEMLALNHSSFKSGDDVNTEPVLLARVSDNVGINLSMAGVGQQMSLMLDGKTSYNDVPFYYTPAADGSPSGEIAYPLSGLTEGHHSLRLRVFDTNGNSATKNIECFVREGLAPTIFDIYTDASPATTEANFYITHDRPDGMLTVTVSVYNLLGHQLWSQTNTGRSEMFTSSPVTWDLTDGTGSRVQRGIYLYRATITADGETYQTASRKIAVSGR